VKMKRTACRNKIFISKEMIAISIITSFTSTTCPPHRRKKLV